MKIIEVTSSQHIQEFLALPITLYREDKHWIRPLDKDIEFVFDSQKNKYFKHGECTRWILQNNEGNTIGRVAAFIDNKIKEHTDSFGQELKIGGMGFFECIKNEQAAVLLFDTCKKWLTERKINTMDGPINFGTRDNWWGLLIEGFDRDPNYQMPYTKAYYQAFFENYGFQTYFKQLTFAREVNEPLDEKYRIKANRIVQDKNYTFECLDLKQLDKYTEDFRTIYNKAWVKHKGVNEMSLAQAQSIMKKMKPIVDPQIVYFAYYDKKPIGFFLNLPEVNQFFKHLNGKLNLWGKIKFKYMQLMGINKKMVGRGFGIVPEHQGKGLEAAIVMFGRSYVQDKIRGRYLDYEMNWIGDFNPKMIHIAESIGKVAKIHITYRKMLDEDLQFERCPEIL
ncbi:MAG: hypothetical protein GY827_02490 [Cytophagales bacterium]|nr:hypothetical protein [Cytophagales bacterium]